MAREFKQVSDKVLENIIKDGFETVGLTLNKKQCALVLRVIISGIGHYFFKNPDDVVEVGFIRFSKSPRKEELFNAEIIYNEEEGIVNARTLNSFYKGDIFKEAKLKEIIDVFIDDLLCYSQEKESDSIKLLKKLNKASKNKKKK